MEKKILAISGSIRNNSTNSYLINAIINLYKDQLDFIIYKGLTDLPHFNPDIDQEPFPETVIDFRKRIKEADGVLICTPEYAMGVPGTLKNAIDWTVSSADFSKKPVALITASSMGEKAHESLLGTLRIIEAKIEEGSELLIPFAKTKINSDNKITDQETSEKIKKLMDSFIGVIGKN
jgi:chromate reductase, NAD(P)H dehydrogenase (quinone)